jgi:hypothetical protein
MKGFNMYAKKQRSLERITAFLVPVYGIVKVCFDFYILVRGH